MKIILTLMLIGSTALARPGENKEALIKRFGQPIGAKIGESKNFVFKKGGFIIHTRVEVEEYYTLESGEALTDTQVSDLLYKLSDYREVTELETTDGRQRWLIGTTGDTKRLWAGLSEDKKTFLISVLIIPRDKDFQKQPNVAGF
jgi:hypothetical protein